MIDVPLDDPRFGRFQRCPNYPVKHDKDMHRRLRRYGNLQAYHGKTFDAFKIPSLGGSYTRNVMVSLQEAKAAGLAFSEDPTGFLVYEGEFGCGKTHLASAIANHRLETYGEQVIFITVPDLLDLLRTTFDSSVDASFDDYFDRIRKTALLVLDDLGVEKRSEWANEKIFQLLNYRLVEGKPTVITTNVAIDDLDPRVTSRLLDRYAVKRVTITAPDYRRGLSRGGNVGPINMQLYKEMRFDTFDTSSALRSEANNLANAKKVAQEWAAKPVGWLFIMGDYGTGKTHLAAAIAYDIFERGREARFMSIPDLLDQLRLAFDPSVNARFDKQFNEIVNSSVLILDDLSLASATPWAKEKLFQIIDKRYLSRKPTVFTSYDTLEETDQRLATRMADSRICTAFAIQARSYVYRIKTNS